MIHFPGDTDSSVVIGGGKAIVEGVEDGLGRKMAMDRDWTWGGEHTTQGTDHVLQAVHLTPV